MRKCEDLLEKLGISKEMTDRKIAETFETMFYGDEDTRIYHPVEPDMGYIEDTGNVDARTEGMSYGMMMCVQLDKKEEFDRIWKWSMTYMYMTEGRNAGYFAWSCKPDGTKNSNGPAPDGEEYYAAALIFASHRWGDGEGIYNYSEWAKTILRDCIHRARPDDPIFAELEKRHDSLMREFFMTKDRSLLDKAKNAEQEMIEYAEKHRGRYKFGDQMWSDDNYLIKFVPGSPYTDPSYHLPHFYEIFADNCDPCDREFWLTAAEKSREYLHSACHPVTGLCPDYSNFDGTVLEHSFNPHAGLHYSDSYRTVYNIALDWAWNKADPWQPEECRKVQRYFEDAGENWDAVPHPDGRLTEEKAMHPVAIMATKAAASIAALDGANESERELAEKLVKEFFEMPLRTGKRRYYDNCLYMFSLLMLAGKYREY